MVQYITFPPLSGHVFYLRLVVIANRVVDSLGGQDSREDELQSSPIEILPFCTTTFSYFLLPFLANGLALSM